MKELKLDKKAEDYLMLTKASELLAERWAPSCFGAGGRMCILQAYYAAMHGTAAKYDPLVTPPPELVQLCQQRVDDHKRFLPPMKVMEGRDSIWRYNDHICSSAEEASTIVAQAADLVLQRD